MVIPVKAGEYALRRIAGSAEEQDLFDSLIAKALSRARLLSCALSLLQPCS
jgi:hypothetical protein